MNHPDAMITISLDRQAEKVRNVQAYGLSQKAMPAGSTDNGPLAGLMGRALPLAMALVVIGTLLLGYVAR